MSHNQDPIEAQFPLPTTVARAGLVKVMYPDGSLVPMKNNPLIHTEATRALAISDAIPKLEAIKDQMDLEPGWGGSYGRLESIITDLQEAL